LGGAFKKEKGILYVKPKPTDQPTCDWNIDAKTRLSFCVHERTALLALKYSESNIKFAINLVT
jgi:hypothetical protein